MRAANITKWMVIFAIILAIFVSGCTDWKKKYENLQVAYKNLEGRIEYERAEKGQLSQQLQAGQQTIDELQKKIAELNQTPAQASGFGEGYDVAFDPAAGTITVTLENTILFSPGKATLKSSTSDELDHILSVLKQTYPGKLIDVVGHTDSDPIKKSKWKDNWELSSQRALSVLRYLVERGISDDKVRAVGRGASTPRDSNSSASGKARNRRVEIVVHVR
jgi:chemotaxis protein MotB